MPPGAAIFAVGDELHADLFLLPDQLLDLGVLDLLQVGGADLAFLALGAGLLQRLGAQEAADLVGAERGFGPLHVSLPRCALAVLLQAERRGQRTLPAWRCKRSGPWPQWGSGAAGPVRGRGPAMSLPQTNLRPPFNITRASHLVLTSRDLAKMRDFYTEVVGLKVSGRIRHHDLSARRRGTRASQPHAQAHQGGAGL